MSPLFSTKFETNWDTLRIQKKVNGNNLYYGKHRTKGCFVNMCHQWTSWYQMKQYVSDHRQAWMMTDTSRRMRSLLFKLTLGPGSVCSSIVNNNPKQGRKMGWVCILMTWSQITKSIIYLPLRHDWENGDKKEWVLIDVSL